MFKFLQHSPILHPSGLSFNITNNFGVMPGKPREWVQWYIDRLQEAKEKFETGEYEIAFPQNLQSVLAEIDLEIKEGKQLIEGMKKIKKENKKE